MSTKGSWLRAVVLVENTTAFADLFLTHNVALYSSLNSMSINDASFVNPFGGSISSGWSKSIVVKLGAVGNPRPIDLEYASFLVHSFRKIEWGWGEAQIAAGSRALITDFAKLERSPNE